MRFAGAETLVPTWSSAKVSEGGRRARRVAFLTETDRLLAPNTRREGSSGGVLQ